MKAKTTLTIAACALAAIALPGVLTASLSEQRAPEQPAPVFTRHDNQVTVDQVDAVMGRISDLADRLVSGAIDQ